MASTGYFQSSDILKESNVPPNETCAEIVKGLARAHKAYLHPDAVKDPQHMSQIYILVVIQPNERNVFDQRFLEYELLQTHNIRVIRRTSEELETQAHLEEGTRKLFIQAATSEKPLEISVVYFRSGYTPVDYPTPRHFETRKMLERSSAIKCPSVALQLAGSKKVQAVLSQPGVLEEFILSNHWVTVSQDNPHIFTDGTVDALRDSWMEMWGLEEEGGVQKARENAQNLVLKPQREGGGNNVYKGDIPVFLDKLSENEREAWIAMALIRVPRGVKNWLVRSGVESVSSNVVSELGVFGWALFGYECDGSTDGKKLRLEEGSGGYLLRTKGEDSDEGGVAAGFSVLDSVILVD
jgi:glutathione synthase